MGKSCGPNEPLGFFTKAHGVEYGGFVKELEEAIEKGGEQGESMEIDPSMVNDTIYQKFVKTAICVSLTTGCLYGAVRLFQAGTAGTFDVLEKRAIQMHGASQLIGSVLLTHTMDLYLSEIFFNKAKYPSKLIRYFLLSNNSE